MQEYACYSVISPEGCATILYRERTEQQVERLAEALRLTARDMERFGIVDDLVPEPVGGAHRRPRRAIELVGRRIASCLAQLLEPNVNDLLSCRYQRYRRLGAHLDGASGDN